MGLGLELEEIQGNKIKSRNYEPKYKKQEKIKDTHQKQRIAWELGSKAPKEGAFKEAGSLIYIYFHVHIRIRSGR